MTPADKKVFIHDLCSSIKHSILEKVDRMPEDWNGIELRQLLADRFADATAPMQRKRMKEYKNTVRILNL